MSVLGLLRTWVAIGLPVLFLATSPAVATGLGNYYGESHPSKVIKERDVIPPTGWTVTADSSEAGNPPTNVLDNNPATFWHTEYSPVTAPLPHNITIDMKTSYLVNGFTYQPRQDGNSNGNIGEHQVQLSTDGATWSSPAIIGTYIDDSSVKQTLFTAQNARYVRLSAFTEAGNRGPWSSCSQINISSTATPAPAPATNGAWGPTIDFPIVPVSAAVEWNSGNLLTWSSFLPEQFTGDTGTGYTLTSTYNPTTGLVTQRNVSNTQHDMFCPGLSMDTTGRPFVTGGNSASRTSIYDPVADAWISGPNMQIGRGYQASCAVSDGRTFTIGGSWSGGEGGKNGEIYSPTSNTWTLLPGCPVAPMLTNDSAGIFRQDNHAWLFAWKNSSVFQAGPSKAMNWYSMIGTGGQKPAGLRGSDPDAMCADAVMYDAVNGKILSAGGSPDYQDSDATTNAHVITIGTPGNIPTVATVSSMAYARAFANGVVLPNGQVFVTGGQSYAVPFSDATSTLVPEMWNPATMKFTTMAPNQYPRVYHSVALLMPDATVISAGGGLCGSGCNTNHLNGEVYRPPYLYNSDGTPATRPIISSVSATSVTVGSTLTIKTNVAVTSFALIRLGSTTHTVNTDHRRIALTPTASGTTYTVTIPSDPGVALPGYWYLFALNSAGVPSVATTIAIKSS